MNNYTIFQSGRGGGKTFWMLRQITEARAAGHKIAVFVPNRQQRDHLARHWFSGAPIDVYDERSFDSSRGYTYGQIFVDNAEGFHDNPVELCRRFHPGVPASFTYSPYPFG